MVSLRIAYALNVAILVPIALPTLLRLFDTAEGRFMESAGYRTLVGSLWTAILVLSLAGLVYPRPFAFVLVLQIVYKALWLGVYALPRLVGGRAREVPRGIALSFVAIVLVWPFLVPWSLLSSSS